jgi:exonuclease-1
MGIDGLLMLLKPITNKMHISSFKGKTLGVDILPWLYKGCYSDIMKMDDSLLLK